MEQAGLMFDAELSAGEKRKYEKRGDIQPHNRKVSEKFSRFLREQAEEARYTEDFYEKLYSAVKKNELTKTHLIPAVIIDLGALAFFIFYMYVNFRYKNVIVLLGLFPLAIFFSTTCQIIKEICKKSRAVKFAEQRENIYAVSLKIDGIRKYTDTSGDSSEDFYYIYSGTMLVRVPKKLYLAAGPDRKLIGAEVGSGKNTLFYAVDVI